MDLLRLEELVKTSEVDHADWNYRGLLGLVQRLRFRLLFSLIGERRFSRVMEIGYGSGVLMPELSRIGDELYGLDIHEENEAITRVLEKRGLRVTLASGTVRAIPFPAEHFGCVVAVSMMEYVEDVPRACAEIRRVLEPGGLFFVVTPGHSPLLDLALRIRTGESAAENYADRRKCLLPILQSEFDTEGLSAARILGFGPVLYTGVALRRKREGSVTASPPTHTNRSHRTSTKEAQ